MEEVQLCDLASDELRDMIAALTAARHRVAAIEASKVVRLVRSAPAELDGSPPASASACSAWRFMCCRMALERQFSSHRG
jgi:hypothetical protein